LRCPLVVGGLLRLDRLHGPGGWVVPEPSVTVDDEERTPLGILDDAVVGVDGHVVEFDQRAGEVRITEATRDLDIYLEVVDRYDIPWSFYYIGFSAIGTTLVALAWLDVAPFSVVPYAGWTVFLLAALLVSSLSHYVLSRRMRLGSGSSPPEVNDA